MQCLYPSLYKLLRSVAGKLRTRLTSKRNRKRCQRHQKTVSGNCFIRVVYTLFDVVKESCRQCQTRKSYVFHRTTYQSVMENFPYIFFRPKSDTKGYVILLFWSTDMDNSACEVQKKIEIVKQKLAVNIFQLRCIVENVPAPRRQFLYPVNNYICLKTQNDNDFYLSADNQKQLESFLKLLNNPEPSKKRKLVNFVSTL